MEFSLNIDRYDDIAYEGDIIIELPKHFNMLKHSEKLEALDSPERHKLIVAVGRDEQDFTIVTGRGKIIHVKGNIPEGDAVPVDGGRNVLFSVTGEVISAKKLIEQNN